MTFFVQMVAQVAELAATVMCFKPRIATYWLAGEWL